MVLKQCGLPGVPRFFHSLGWPHRHLPSLSFSPPEEGGPWYTEGPPWLKLIAPFMICCR